MIDMNKIVNYIKTNKYVLLALYLPIYLISFFLIEKYVTGDFWVSYMWLDDYIPFCEYFIIPYVLWYPALFATGIYMLVKKDAEAFKRFMAFIICGFSISIIFCILVPNCQNLRPTVFAHNNIFTKLIKMIYAADTNTNVFPSVHVLGAIVIPLGVFDCSALKSKKFLRVISIILAILITASTVFIKQHSILDIFSAIILALILFLIIYIIIPKVKQHKKSIKSIQKNI